MNLDQINDIPDILMEFLEYHSTVRGHSDRTVSAYYMDLKILLRYLKRKRKIVPRDVPFNEIDITDVDLDFIGATKIEELYGYQSFSPESGQSLSAASRCRRTSSVKSFFNYLVIRYNILPNARIRFTLFIFKIIGMISKYKKMFIKNIIIIIKCITTFY